MTTPSPDLWNIVLAAGDGTRLASLVKRLHGDDRPKQFAVLKGQRSLLQETVVRMSAVAPARRTVVVVPDRHRLLAEAQLAAPLPGIELLETPRLVAQPCNVGTGPGILLPLMQVLARDPRATVAITPSDHHFDRPTRFTARLGHAASAARACTSGICLLAVEAESPSSELGWIVPGPPLAERPGANLIERFVEKPSAAVASGLLDAGGLWNTFVMVGQAAAFLQLARRWLPTQAALFETYLSAVDTVDEAAALQTLYARLTAADFSRDVLSRAEGLAVVAVGGAGWSDWGTPERLMHSLRATPDLSALRWRLAHAA
jgi:mannose-1-phosphate guanylyltransferase